MSGMRIGFIGTGVMGLPMARNLLKAGFAVTAYNRTRAKAEPLIAEGATVVDSPREVALASDVVISIVSDTPDVREVLTGQQGALAGARPGMVMIDMSTISPSATREIAAILETAGVDMLDAPVSGGDIGAIDGTLSIMVGGKPEVFERCRPVFEAMGKRLVYCGGHGTGQTVKLCNQIAIANHVIAASEAIAFGKKAGIDPKVMLEAVGAGAAGSWVINNLGARMVDGDFAPGFMIKLQQKDLRLVMQMASELSVSLPSTAVTHQLFAAAEAAGQSDLGAHSVVTVLEKLAGL